MLYKIYFQAFIIDLHKMISSEDKQPTENNPKPIQRLKSFTKIIGNRLLSQKQQIMELIAAIEAVTLDNQHQQQTQIQIQNPSNNPPTVQIQIQTIKQKQTAPINAQLLTINESNALIQQNQMQKRTQYKKSYHNCNNNVIQQFNRYTQNIGNKQIQAFNDLISNIKSLKVQENQAYLETRNNANAQQKAGLQTHKINTINKTQQDIQSNSNKIQITELPHLEQQLELHKIMNQKNLNELKNNSKLEQVKNYCQNLKSQYQQKNYTLKNIQNLAYHLSQIYANNSYLCIQDTFQLLKEKFHIHHSNNQIKKVDKNISKSNMSLRKSQLDPEFNLQLTIKSKISKNSGHIDRHDSLIYSNATSFGLNSTNNRPKQTNKNTKSKNRSLNNKDQINLNNKDQNDFDMIHIDKTSSKGDVQNQQKSFSAKSFSDTERINKYPPRGNYQNRSSKNSSQQKIRIPSLNMSVQSNQNNKHILRQRNQDEQMIQQQSKNSINYNIFGIKQNKNQIKGNKSPIREQDNYQILSLQNKEYQQNQQNQENQERKNYPQEPYHPSDQKFKKSFSIKSHNPRKINAKINGKKSDDISVFSSEINNLEGRISRIKQAKISKKKKLQEQLNKINLQIQELKRQEGSREKQQGTRQNTMQSRIKINDNLQQKKKAVKLVKNLRAQKISREMNRKKQIKVLDKDIHQKMQEIMKLKYFNEQKIKQKKKLQIIQRMKLQQIRKITQQQQKQNSIQFLSKIKNGDFSNEQNNMEYYNNSPPSNKKQQQQIEKDQYQNIKHYYQKQKHQYHKDKHQHQKQKYGKSQKQKKVLENINPKTKKNLQESRDKPIMRTPHRTTQIRQIDQPLTNPILQKKKAYLNKIRNFTVIKRSKHDIYEQILN